MSQWIPGRLIKRYKRFLADIELDDGTVITAHCTNTGKMLGLTQPGNRVMVSYQASATRRYPYTWEMTWVDQTWVGSNTQWPNRLIGHALRHHTLPDMPRLHHVQAEVTFDNSRFDFRGHLDPTPSDDPSRTVWVEVKNVHWRRGEEACAEFPDSVTTRGARHVTTLQKAVQQGYQAWMIYVVQRQDCVTWDIARDIDVEYGHAVAQAQGVQFMAYACDVSPTGITLDKKLSYRKPT